MGLWGLTWEFLWQHDDVIKWQHFPRYWPFVRPHKGQWHGALMFSLICVSINDWVNTREAGDLRRYRTHYDVIVMDWVAPTPEMPSPVGSLQPFRSIPSDRRNDKIYAFLKSALYLWGVSGGGDSRFCPTNMLSHGKSCVSISNIKVKHRHYISIYPIRFWKETWPRAHL